MPENDAPIPAKPTNGNSLFGLGTFGPIANISAVALVFYLFFASQKDQMQQLRDFQQRTFEASWKERDLLHEEMKIFRQDLRSIKDELRNQRLRGGANKVPDPEPEGVP